MAAEFVQPPDDAGVTPQLNADLAALYGSQPSVPAAVDASIRAEARRRGGHIRRMRLLLRWGGAAAAAAAVLLVALPLVPTRAPVFHAGTHVTILDAFSLARQLKANAR